MKYGSLLIFLSVMFAVSCSNPQPQPETPKSSVLAEDDQALLKKAQGIFSTLPSVAESNENPLSQEKIRLGHILFYDNRLSKTGNNSCNSCHDLNKFGVDNLPTSKGDKGKFGNRNSPTVLNAALHTSQFWDGRAKDVEEQAGGPILNPDEMDMPSKEALVRKLKSVNGYPEMFKAAFQDEKDPITYLNIQRSIAAFERTLLTPSPFDNYLKGDLTALSAQEKEGLSTFISSGCTQCHNGMLLGGTMFQKFGLFDDYRKQTKSTMNDEGRKAVTKEESDKDYFKVPSLRNIAKTGPYFHDGSVSDLTQAIKIMAKIQLNKDLTDQEADKIHSFLNSLTGEVPKEAKKPEALR